MMSSLGWAQQVEVTLKNGDQMGLSDLTMNGKFIQGKLVMAGGASVKIDCEKVNAVSVKQPEEEPSVEEQNLFEILLRDHGLLKGKVLSFSKNQIKMDVLGVGEVNVPLAAVLSVSKEGAPMSSAVVAPGHTTVLLDKENAISGKLTDISGTKFTIEREGLKAEFDSDAMLSMRFSDSEQSHTAKFAVQFLHGSRCYASDVSVDKGTVKLTVLGGEDMRVPLKSVKQLQLMMGNQYSQKGVVFLECLGAPNSREVQNTGVALKEGLAGWKIEHWTDYAFGDDFDAKLMLARAVVIPEFDSSIKHRYQQWCQGNKVEGEEEKEFPKLEELLGKQLRSKLRSFVERGGNIILLGHGANQIDRLLNLVPITRNTSCSSEDCYFTRGGFEVSKGVGDSYRPPYTCQVYTTGGSDVIFARARHGTTLYGRRVKQGWVIVNGYDMYQPSAEIAKVIANSVKLKP